MATFLNEQRMLNDTLFNYEKNFHSPMARFIDKTPTPVTYYHIADEATTVDEGFNDVDDFLGDSSPIRYRKIEGLPLYGLEAFVLQLEDSDQGLDQSYEGSFTLINSTITPKHHDKFMIPGLKDYYIFTVISISNDHIMPDNYYQADFKLSYVDRSKAQYLEKQTIERYNCVLENIGTDRKCIVRSDIVEKTKAVDVMYRELRDLYVSIFYNDRYNCFLGELDGPSMKIYDPFQVEFINRHHLFIERNQMDGIIPTEQFMDNKRRLKYERSIYRFFERRDLQLLSRFQFNVFLGKEHRETGFAYYADPHVFVLDLPEARFIAEDSVGIFSEEFVNCMKEGSGADTKYGQFLIDYIRDEKLSMLDIPDGLADEMLSLNADVELFFIVPIILYIIQELKQRAYEKKSDTAVSLEV